jgi:uncharacterized iron-regulated membrane protein
MSVWNKWLRQPQSMLLRRILFQVHLWVGVSLGLYILMISVTGSLLVYRRELSAAVGPVHVTPLDRRLTRDELSTLAQRAYPGFILEQVFTPRNRGEAVPDQAIEVRLRRGDDTIERLLDPYTGADLGDSVRPALTFILWLADLHDDLLGGPTGRLVNGIGAIFATLLAATGAVLWWPGIRNWRRSLTIDWKRKRHGFNWSLHNAVGFWMLAFVLLWGISGIYFSFPKPFNALVDFLEPLNESNPQTRIGDSVLFWLAQLHFGRFNGLTLKAVWTVLGLAPALLTVTGGLMWWHRVVRRQPRRVEQLEPAAVATHAVQSNLAFSGKSSAAQFGGKPNTIQ